MSGPTDPGSTPPEVPEEFAAAYRAAYERALAGQSAHPHRGPAEPESDELYEGEDTEATDDAEDAHDAEGADDESELDDAAPEDAELDGDGHAVDESYSEESLPERTGPIAVGTHRADPPEDAAPSRLAELRASRWFVPAMLALLALALILGAYAVGRAFAGRVESTGAPTADPSVVISESNQSAPSAKPKPKPTAEAKAWDGKVARVDDVEARTGCTSRPGVDASGDRVDYRAENMTDGEADTTWRCAGTAIGQKITLRLDERTSIGEVGLIPGYAKTDETSGADRFAENNRITRVRWTIGDTVVEQRMSGAPGDRSMRLVRLPKTEARSIELEILAVARGPRNTTAISEIRVGATS